MGHHRTETDLQAVQIPTRAEFKLASKDVDQLVTYATDLGALTPQAKIASSLVIGGHWTTHPVVHPVVGNCSALLG